MNLYLALILAILFEVTGTMLLPITKEFSKLISYDDSEYFRLNLKYFSHHNNPNFSYKFKNGIPYFENLYNENFYKLFGEVFKSNIVNELS